MKNPIKKISSLFIMLAALMPLLFTLFLLLKQQIIRHEMKEKLEEKTLHTIKISRSEIQWVKFEKEIRVDGKMFDIKSFSINNGEYIITGLYDEEETALNTYFEKNCDQNKTATNQLLSSLFKMLESMYSNDTMKPMASVAISRSFAPLFPQQLSSPYKVIITPPPQLAVAFSF